MCDSGIALGTRGVLVILIGEVLFGMFRSRKRRGSSRRIGSAPLPRQSGAVTGVPAFRGSIPADLCVWLG